VKLGIFGLSLYVLAQVVNPYRLDLRDEGTSQGRISALNCTGAGVACSVSAGVGTVNVEGGGGGAPTGATYITQTADGTLSAEQALSPLATGIVKVTNGTGVLSTAIAADFPTLNQNTTGTAANVTGTVAIANGGTGQAGATAAFDALAPSSSQGDLIYHNGTDNVRLAKGTANQQLRMNGGATAPEWFSPSGGGGATVTRLVVTADRIINSASYTDVTDLTLAVSSGATYSFECHLRGTQSVAGDQFWAAINGPSSTWIGYSQIIFTSATAHTAVSATAFDATAGLPTSGATTAGLPHQVKGSFLTSASGTFAVRVRRDAGTGTTTVLRGSYCLVVS
jgi:hypothetical protein